MIFRWDGVEWTPTDTGDAGLRDIEVVGDDSDGVTVGDGDTIYDLTGGRWEQASTSTGENLKAVVRGHPDVAVGAGETVVER